MENIAFSLCIKQPPVVGATKWQYSISTGLLKQGSTRETHLSVHSVVRKRRAQVINWRELTEVQRSRVFDKFRFDTPITFTSTLGGSGLLIMLSAEKTLRLFCFGGGCKDV